MENNSDIKRIEAWLRRGHNPPVIAMERSVWDNCVQPGNPISISIRETPIGGVEECASVMAVVASQILPATVHVDLYRKDPRDHPNPVNKDSYEVWLDLWGNSSLDDMVAAASTEKNEELQRYAENHVFWVKKDPGLDHHQPTLPSVVWPDVRYEEGKK